MPYDDPNYFTDHILLQPESIEDAKGIMNGKLFLAVTLCWIITFICVHKGVKSASIAVKITMPLPFLLLFILLIKGLTLPGAGDGIRRYLDFSDWSELGNIGMIGIHCKYIKFARLTQHMHSHLERSDWSMFLQFGRLYGSDDSIRFIQP